MISAPPQNPSYGQGFARRGESAKANLWHGLIGAWHPPLGPTGLTLFDQSGYGNHGALLNMDPGTDWVMTEKGWALDFDGGNDMICLGAAARVTAAHAICVLLKPSSWTHATYPGVFGGHSLGSTGGVALTRVSSNLYYNVYDGDTRRSPYIPHADVPVGEWTMLVCQWDGTSGANALQIYIDGQLGVAAWGTGLTIPLDWTSAPSGFRIANSNRDNFQGQIALFAIWSRVLAPAEIMELHNDSDKLLRQEEFAIPLPGKARPLVGGSLAGNVGLIA